MLPEVRANVRAVQVRVRVRVRVRVWKSVRPRMCRAMMGPDSPCMVLRGTMQRVVVCMGEWN